MKQNKNLESKFDTQSTFVVDFHPIVNEKLLFQFFAQSNIPLIKIHTNINIYKSLKTCSCSSNGKLR